MSDNQRIAQEVIRSIGGKENIASFAHCATRLRIMVKDKEKIDQQQVENIDKVKGAFFNSGQYQIIFGTGTVNRIFEEVEKLGIEGSSKDDVKSQGKRKATLFNELSARLVTCLFQLFLCWWQRVCSWDCGDCSLIMRFFPCSEQLLRIFRRISCYSLRS